MLITEGQKAPDFIANIADGTKIRLSDFRGKKVVLYFYPKDNTPGCTKEACSLRDTYGEILDKGAVVIGVSPDNIQSHDRFAKKYDLPFYLASDQNHHIAEAYGVWAEKKLFGKLGFGILRSTFIINEEGDISKVFAKVNTSEHGNEVLVYL